VRRTLFQAIYSLRGCPLHAVAAPVRIVSCAVTQLTLPGRALPRRGHTVRKSADRRRISASASAHEAARSPMISPEPTQIAALVRSEADGPLPEERTVSPLPAGRPSLAIRLFGAMEVHVGGSPIPPLRTRKGEWLLALLALKAGAGVRREWLDGQAAFCASATAARTRYRSAPSATSTRAAGTSPA
jgi:hypothetical protein